MNIKKITAALTAAVLVLSAAGNVTVMADESTSQTTSDTASDVAGDSTSSGEDSTGSAETPDETGYTLTNVKATVTDGGWTLPEPVIKIDSNGSTITVTAYTSWSVPPASVTVNLTGTATDGTNTVELTAAPVTVNPRVKPNTTHYTLKNTDEKVSLSGEVRVEVHSRPKKWTFLDVSAVVTDTSEAVVSSEVTDVGSDSITITVPYNTPDGDVTVKLTGTADYEYDDTTETITLTADPVTVEIDNNLGTTYLLTNGKKYSQPGKVFVKKAKAPTTSEPSTSTSDSSDTSASTPDTSEPSTSTTSPSAVGTISTPSDDVSSTGEKEFKPELSDTDLNDETKRVLGGITVTDTNGAFDDDVVMNVKPGQTTNGFSFDITFTKNGKEVQPNGNVTVKIPVPETLRDKNIYVFHVEDGRFVLVDSEVKGGFVIFSADHFSEYILSAYKLSDNSEASDNTSATVSTPTEPSNPDTGVAAAAVPVLLAVSAAVIVITKKKK